MRIAVLGAGVSGLTVAKKLSEENIDVKVYEQCDKPGGLARSRITDGYVYDPHGGHIFNSKHTEIVDWIFSLLPKNNWQYTVRNAKIFFGGKYVSYPFELSLCELDIEDAANCVHDFMQSQEGVEPENFKDWLTWNFGESIANYYMIPYNSKIWAYPLDKMETKWMQGKMPLPTKKEIIKSLLLKDPKERKMPHSTFYYPIEGGIQTMVNAIAKGLNISLNTPVKEVKKIDGKWFVNGEGPYDRVISTIPLPRLSKVMDMPNNVKDAIDDLKYNSLTTMLYKCPATDISWLYIPSMDYRAHRVGYQGTLSPKACPEGCSGALEIIGDKFEIDRSSLELSTLLPYELGFTDMIDNEFTEYAYVIHDSNYRKNTGCVEEHFDKIDGFDLLGRFAKWNYNNMDLCMRDAFELTREIVSLSNNE